MKKKLFVILIVFVCVFSMHAASVHASEDVIPNDETGVPDKVLYQSILYGLGKKENETFTRQEAASIDIMSVQLYKGQRCQRLKGIGCLGNLRQLDLRGIEKIEGIEELKQLENLDLSFARITLKKHWKPLQKLKSLECLTIDNCKLSNLKGTGIEKLSNLRRLYANECGLKKVDELKNLKNLEILYLSDNRLTDMKALKGLKNLRILDLGSNRLNDAKEVQYLKGLEKLGLGYNGLKKLPDMRSLKNLEDLYLTGNYLTEKEIKAKVPQKILKDKYFKEHTYLFQRNNAVIHLKSPTGINGITKNTKKISGRISLISGYKNGYYVCLSNPDSSKYRNKRWKVKPDGSFEINNLDLRSRSEERRVGKECL